MMKLIISVLILVLVQYTKTQNAPCLLSHIDWDGHRQSVLNKIYNANQKYHMSNNLMDLELYDFIIAGAGAGGSTVVATLLKRNPKLKLLLIELGDPLNTDPFTCDYTQFFRMYFSKYMYTYHSEEMKFCSKNGCTTMSLPIPSGRCLGGGSTVNWMMWTRGNPEDYNLWADMVEDETWTYNNLLPNFREIEQYKEDPSTSEYRGDSGDVYVTKTFTSNPTAERFLNAMNLSGFPLNGDYNAESNVGVSYIQQNILPVDPKHPEYSGFRQDAFSTQLKRFKIGEGSLDVLTQCRVLNVVLSDTNDVSYLVFSNNGKEYKVRAKYETVISAGAIESPAILLRSGIGPCDDMMHQRLDINCTVDLPVGKYLQNHLIFEPPGRALYNGSSINQNLMFHAFFGEIELNLTETTHLLPQFQLIFYNLGFENAATQYVFYGITMLHETSRGTVKLNKENPSGDPLIDFNFLSTEYDREQINQGFIAITHVETNLQAMKLLDRYSFMTNDTIQTAVNNMNIDCHMVGTCRMGSSNDKKAVVNSKLQVKGVNGLRVCDASIMPEITSANTNAPAFLIHMTSTTSGGRTFDIKLKIL